MNSILFVAFEFPPFTTGGVHRPLRMVNRLKAYGWHPIVITVDHEGIFGKVKCDNTLAEYLDPDVQVVRTNYQVSRFRAKFIRTGYSFQADEVFNSWKLHFKAAVREVFKREQPKAVFITVPPFSIYALGIWVKETFGVPLIVDMRDAWSNWVVAPFATRVHYEVIKRQERKLLSAADAILVTSPQTINDFQHLHPNIPAGRFHFVPNGFDDFVQALSSEIRGSEKVRIGYVGSFYYNPVSQALLEKPWYRKKPYQYLQYVPHHENWLYRTPYFFFDALARLIAAEPAYATKVELVFAGAIPEWFDSMVRQFGLEQVIVHHGRVSKAESLRLQQTCDLLLLTSAKVIGGEDYSIAGKTYEYFSMGKPILGFVCAGAQKWVLEQSGMAVVIDPDDRQQAALNLKAVIDGAVALHPNHSFLNQFRNEHIMEQFASILNSLMHDEN